MVFRTVVAVLASTLALATLFVSPAAASPCAEGMFFVEQSILNAASASVTLSGIPAQEVSPNCDNTSIHMDFIARSDSTTCDPALNMQVGHNGTIQTGSKYNNQLNYNFGTGWGAVNQYHATSAEIAQAPCTTRSADAAVSCMIDIPEAFEATFYHQVLYHCSNGYDTNATGTGVTEYSGSFMVEDVSTITDVKFSLGSGNFVQSSEFMVWVS